MELHNLPNDKKKKIALGVATSVSVILLLVWGYRFTTMIPSKITETKKDAEELSVVGKGVANVYLSVKSEVSKVGAMIKEQSQEIRQSKENESIVSTTTESIIEEQN